MTLDFVFVACQMLNIVPGLSYDNYIFGVLNWSILDLIILAIKYQIGFRP